MAYSQGGTPVTGAKGLANFLTQRLKYNLEEAEVYEAAPSETPWLTFLLRMARKPTDAREFKSFANDPSWINRKFFAAGAGAWAGNAIADLAVDDGSGGNVGFLVDGLVCRVNHVGSATDTVFVITNVDSQSQIDIRSLPGEGSNEVNIADNDPIQVIGVAMGTSAKAATAMNSVLAQNTGYAQDFENAWSMEDTAEAEVVFGPNEWERLAAETLKTHKTDMNRAAILGTLDKETVTISGRSVTLYSTYGAMTFLEDNTAQTMNAAGVQTPSYATYDYNSFIDDMENLYALGSGNKIGVAGSTPLAMFSKIGTGSFLSGANVEVKQVTEFGLSITKVRHPFGVFNLVWDKALRGSGLYKDILLGVDPAYIKWRPLVGNGKNFDTHLVTNTQARDEIRQRRYAYRTVAGVEMAFPSVHGRWLFS